MKPGYRVVIQHVTPEIDSGRFPIKRILGEQVAVEADIFSDGHDVLSAVLLHRNQTQPQWKENPMTPLGNDRWHSSFIPTEIGTTIYTIKAWVHTFLTWKRNFKIKLDVDQDIELELLMGWNFYKQAIQIPNFKNHSTLAVKDWEKIFEGKPNRKLIPYLMDEAWTPLMDHITSHNNSLIYSPELRVTVDRERAAYGSWYEIFPRSCPGRKNKAHGTFQDVSNYLPTISSMGFDVLYLPPIHPIGVTNRKGKNNARKGNAQDIGSPWAIGAKEGGHKSIHPQLGSLEDFKTLLKKAKELHMEIALDIAYQCSPDHPYVTEHPSWFRRLPDGSIQFAENPPKKYEDIYPLYFDTEDRKALWEELKSVVDYWILQGVKIFRVDNPHTKPFDFWEWLIEEVKKEHPDVIFLSEAFTRPALMMQLAKVGFTQSYNYFPWKNSKWELTHYITELTQTGVLEYFRPNFWPNTPDILTEYLQKGGRPGFVVRYLLAATLGTNYGIYGPAFELCENRPREEGGEEYLNSEKYEIWDWNMNDPRSLKSLITHVNQLRRNNTALGQPSQIQFHEINNDQILCFSKQSTDRSNQILVVINLDPHNKQSGWLKVPLQLFNLPSNGNYRVYDLLTDLGYLWNGESNYIELNPDPIPAHIFRIEKIA